MKKIFSAALVAAAGLALTGCNDFLDDNRFPLTQIVNSPQYWNNPANCELQTNRFYQYFYGFSTGQGAGNFYFNTRTDDQAGNSFADWAYTIAPTSSGSWNTPYSIIRGCNIIIENVQKSSLSDPQKNNYIGIARMMRGFEYYQLVKQYGDVPLVKRALDVNSKELYGARTPRDTVMDFAYEDILFASQNISLEKGVQKFSRDMASAMLSDLCLYEGTFWKYCTVEDNYYAPRTDRSTTYLQRCADVSKTLIAKYPINGTTPADYRKIYNSSWAGDKAMNITALSTNPEIIFATQYEKDVLGNSLMAYTCSSTMISGITKDAFDNYLFKDGKPLALTSMNKNDEGVAVTNLPTAQSANGKGIDISALLEVRDARLSQTTDPYVYFAVASKDAADQCQWIRKGANPMSSSTGYGVCKYDNVNMEVIKRTTIGQCYSSSPLYWGSVVALNYAEAQAELGKLTDADMDLTLNKLYKRGELPAQTVASLSSMNDPANNMGVSSLIWEVRRCRRCELIMDNDFRYWDLVRWHQLELLDSKAHPNILLGANVKNCSPVPLPANMTGNYINGSFGKTRVYDNRQYEWPLPADQLTLNPALEQNANWKPKL